MERLSIAEAARLLGVHPARVAHWIGSGRLEPVPSADQRGRQCELDRSAVLALRQELDARPTSDVEAEPEERIESAMDPLSRARAVESYTAGLAATAIAPAMARLVETIDRLIAENGDLREQNGRLKAELTMGQRHSMASEPDVASAEPSSPSTSGLTPAEWSSLGERIDRLSRPVADSPGPFAQPVTVPTSASVPIASDSQRARGNPRQRRLPGARTSPLRRMAAWMLKKLVED